MLYYHLTEKEVMQKTFQEIYDMQEAINSYLAEYIQYTLLATRGDAKTIQEVMHFLQQQNKEKQDESFEDATNALLLSGIIRKKSGD